MPQKSRKQYISKGVVGRPMKTPATGAEKIMNKVNAWVKGKKVNYCESWGSYRTKSKLILDDS